MSPLSLPNVERSRFRRSYRVWGEDGTLYSVERSGKAWAGYARGKEVVRAKTLTALAHKVFPGG